MRQPDLREDNMRPACVIAGFPKIGEQADGYRRIPFSGGLRVIRDLFTDAARKEFVRD